MHHIAALKEIVDKEHKREALIQLCISQINQLPDDESKILRERLAGWLEQPSLFKSLGTLESMTEVAFADKLEALLAIVQSPEFMVYYLARLLACQEEVNSQRIKQDLSSLKPSHPEVYKHIQNLVTLTFQRIVHYPMQMDNLKKQYRGEDKAIVANLSRLSQWMRWFTALSKHLPQHLEAKHMAHTPQNYTEQLHKQLNAIKTLTYTLANTPDKALTLFCSLCELGSDAEISIGIESLSEPESQQLLRLHQAQSLSNQALNRLAHKLRFDAAHGKLSTLSFLLDLGVDVNALSNQTTRSTALHKAIEANQLDVVKLLVKRGADIELKNGLGRSALQAAICFGHDIIANLLIDKGAHVFVTDTDGDTPLHSAVRLGDGPVCQRLCEKLVAQGADWEATNAAGQTPTELSESLEQAKHLEEAYHTAKETQLKTLTATIAELKAANRALTNEVNLLNEELQQLKVSEPDKKKPSKLTHFFSSTPQSIHKSKTEKSVSLTKE